MIRGRPGRGPEMNSGDFVVRVERQAHRQLAALAMQPKRDPPAVAVPVGPSKFSMLPTCVVSRV